MSVKDMISYVTNVKFSNNKATLPSNKKKDNPNFIQVLKDAKYPLSNIKRYI